MSFVTRCRSPLSTAQCRGVIDVSSPSPSSSSSSYGSRKMLLVIPHCDPPPLPFRSSLSSSSAPICFLFARTLPTYSCVALLLDIPEKTLQYSLFFFSLRLRPSEKLPALALLSFSGQSPRVACLYKPYSSSSSLCSNMFEDTREECVTNSHAFSKSINSSSGITSSSSFSSFSSLFSLFSVFTSCCVFSPPVSVLLESTTLLLSLFFALCL
mmetsp:Transcript_590/g.1105  ORF Transcript_590/g.1105 Transcript_590/m.1105 type:complete len:212 (-) Transcript_590:308-943(-)